MKKMGELRALKICCIQYVWTNGKRTLSLRPPDIRRRTQARMLERSDNASFGGMRAGSMGKAGKKLFLLSLSFIFPLPQCANKKGWPDLRKG